MKLSLCTTGFKEWDIDEIIKWVAPMNQDVKGLELWSKHIERFQEKHGPLDKLARLLESNGIQIRLLVPIRLFQSYGTGSSILVR